MEVFIARLSVIPIDSLRILILMTENIGGSSRDQDFFKMEEETDEEFGMPELRVHLADSLTPAVLKDWTAADFASIYVRFRPHLERHARKFLNNHSQVEEVVQEAFLYLMTTLPELDSELGVLKFLKWKTRLLALDVIRANSKVTLAPIDESPDLASNDPELSQDLERAEDAGIVALALSKIQPRHREAIIATLYEEKSADVVAAQMGLSENAFRQLLFRARSSFRKALVGEAETQGKSISEILSIAARKAAKESGKYISAAGVLVALWGFTLTFPYWNGVQSSPNPSPVALSQLETLRGSGPPERIVQDYYRVEERRQEAPLEVDTAVTSPVQVEPTIETIESFEASPQKSQQVQAADPLLSPTSMATILSTNVSNAGIYSAGYNALLGDLFRGVSVEIFGGTGISAFLDLELGSASVNQVIFQMRIEEDSYLAVAQTNSIETLIDDGGYTIAILAQGFYVVDLEGNVFSESPLATSSASITLELDQDRRPIAASMKIDP